MVCCYLATNLSGYILHIKEIKAQTKQQSRKHLKVRVSIFYTIIFIYLNYFKNEK